MHRNSSLKHILLSLILLVISITTLASDTETKPHYAIVIDAGSSGSRMHVIEYQPKQGDTPAKVIPTTLSYKVSPGIASFADHPEDLSSYLQPLFDAANAALEELNASDNTPLYLYGTAGMRLLDPAKQANLYEAAETITRNTSTFEPKEFRTITGKEEALFSWLSVNLLSNTLSSDHKTLGIVEVGGASSQIAFAVNPNQQKTLDPNTLTTFTLGQRQYTLLAKSILGLGADKASYAAANEACYVSEYPLGDTEGQWDNNTCVSNIDNLLTKTNVQSTAHTITSDMSFIGLSSIDYTYSFFKLPKSATLDDLTNAYQQDCQLSWSEFSAKHPNTPKKYLGQYCFNAAYIKELLKSPTGYGFDPASHQIQAMSEINNTDITWTYGALFNQLNQPSTNDHSHP